MYKETFFSCSAKLGIAASNYSTLHCQLLVVSLACALLVISCVFWKWFISWIIHECWRMDVGQAYYYIDTHMKNYNTYSIYFPLSLNDSFLVNVVVILTCF